MHQCENCKKSQQVGSQQQKMSPGQLAKDSSPTSEEQKKKQGSKEEERDEQNQANKEPQGGEKVPNNRSGEEQPPKAEVGTLVPREGDGRWGRLPQRVIEQMYDNGQRKLPEKYRLVLEEYFRRLPLDSQ
ncbi:MAG: hypothetical protein L0Z55_05135 [Planctomycetes bacterium]|nr:hypothetical protein [Planctomycetota bacterium]